MKFIAVTVVCACAVGWWLVDPCSVGDDVLRQAASAIACVGATMLGFVLAILAILVSLADRRLIRNMHKTGHFVSLLSRLFTVAIYFGFLTVIAMAALLLSGLPLRVAMASAFGVTASSVLQLALAGRTLWRVLERLVPKDGPSLE